MKYVFKLLKSGERDRTNVVYLAERLRVFWSGVSVLTAPAPLIGQRDGGWELRRLSTVIYRVEHVKFDRFLFKHLQHTRSLPIVFPTDVFQ